MYWIWCYVLYLEANIWMMMVKLWWKAGRCRWPWWLQSSPPWSRSPAAILSGSPRPLANTGAPWCATPEPPNTNLIKCSKQRGKLPGVTHRLKKAVRNDIEYEIYNSKNNKYVVVYITASRSSTSFRSGPAYWNLPASGHPKKGFTITKHKMTDFGLTEREPYQV